MNVSASKLISQDIGINLLQIASLKTGPSAVDWIDGEFEMTTGLSAETISPVYLLMLSQLDELILENKLKQDPALWIVTTASDYQV